MIYYISILKEKCHSIPTLMNKLKKTQLKAAPKKLLKKQLHSWAPLMQKTVNRTENRRGPTPWNTKQKCVKITLWKVAALTAISANLLTETKSFSGFQNLTATNRTSRLKNAGLSGPMDTVLTVQDANSAMKLLSRASPTNSIKQSSGASFLTLVAWRAECCAYCNKATEH